MIMSQLCILSSSWHEQASARTIHLIFVPSCELNQLFIVKDLKYGRYSTDTALMFSHKGLGTFPARELNVNLFIQSDYRSEQDQNGCAAANLMPCKNKSNVGRTSLFPDGHLA